MSSNAILEAMRQSLASGSDGQMHPGAIGHIGSLGNIGGFNFLRLFQGIGQQMSSSLVANIITSAQQIVGGDKMKKRLMAIFGRGPVKLPRLSDPGEGALLAGGQGIMPPRLDPIAPGPMTGEGFNLYAQAIGGDVAPLNPPAISSSGGGGSHSIDI